jgi:hypothetical protein
MFKKIIYVFISSIVVAGCVITPMTQTPPSTTQIQDASTQYQPDRIYLETPESKSVTIGSYLQASIAGCTNMQRYRIKTNTDFLSTLHLFKYRAALMGAKRIVIVNHTEIDSKEFYASSDRNPTLIREGTTLQGSSLFTILTADLYACPVV